jgi:hypothetical protein
VKGKTGKRKWRRSVVIIRIIADKVPKMLWRVDLLRHFATMV